MPKNRPTRRHERGKRGSRKLKTVVTLIVQGKVTEQQYFTQMKALRNWERRISVKIDPYPKSPNIMTDRATQLIDQQDSDIVILVFDWDNSPQSEVEYAIRAGKKRQYSKKIYVAISYPKFDLWLCAHRQVMKQGCDASKVTEIEKKLAILEPKGSQLRKHMPASFEYENFREAAKNTNSVGFGEWDLQGSTAIPAVIDLLDNLT